MAEEVTKILMPESCGTDPASLMAMMNSSNGLGGNNWIWVLFLFMLYGRNGLGFNGNSELGQDLLMQAINGNKEAIGNLSTTMNCNMGQINNAINAVQMAVQQSGCELGHQITTQGYENRLANQEQTGILGSKIDNQTNVINNQFCALKEREMQTHIDELIEKNSSLKSQIDNANQTAQIQQYISNLITPLQSEVSAIKAAQPATTTVPYPQLTAVPTSYLYGYGNYGSMWS